MQKIIYILTFTIGTIFNSFGQTAILEIERIFFDNSFDGFDSIYFDINGTKFYGEDTLTKIIKLNDNFDSCTAIIGNDTLKFLTKFQNGQVYVLRPGCCCGAFTLQAKQNSNRGTITFRNKCDRDLGIVICEHNSDTVIVDSKRTFYAHESAMCLFRTCQVRIVETNYFSDEFEYKNDDINYFRLWLERENYVLNQIWFHFLHGEKIEIIFVEKNSYINIRIIGYLTKEELDEHWK